jgi:hypothetical protein
MSLHPEPSVATTLAAATTGAKERVEAATEAGR